jgi:hypothetical protein
MSLRVISSYALAGTRSYRLSSRKVFSRWGMNIQNPDKHTQDIMCAPPGHSIVQADQAGAEALVVAYLARPGRYRALFLNGVKPHTYIAMHLYHEQFGLELDSIFLNAEVEEFVKHVFWSELHKRIKSSGTPYDMGKRTAHGASYMMGPRTFREAIIKMSRGKLVLTIAQCKFFLEKFKLLFPEIVEWQDSIKLRICADRKLTNLFGFERVFEREINDGYFREAISWIPQSTVGCITHMGVRAARKALLSVCSNKHDSYATICRDDEVRDVASFMKSSMALELQGVDCTFIMKSEVQVGKNWKPYHKDKNPLGMKELE